jgi:rhamnose utilization protein RhaD (predicted bifunctional aldolase and dehydrogenase)
MTIIKPSLDGLIAHSFKIGLDTNLVQGAGGNTSYKDENFLWVKASGTKLRDAIDKNIFVKLDLDKARKLSFFDDAKLIYTAILDPIDENLRPSIETAMHSIIASPVVTHVHSLGSIGSSILKNPNEAIEKISGIVNMAWIPYLRPGAELAKAISEVVNESHNALLLGNHGMTVWGDSFSEVESLISEIENNWRGNLKKKLDFVEQNRISEMWANVLCGGILTPDEAVFLGEKPFGKANEPNTKSAKIKFLKNNEILFDPKLSNDSKDIAKLLIDLDGWINDIKDINYLNQSEIHNILNWEMEKFRQGLNK